MCEPPRYGSLWTITSPGSNASAPTSSITQRPEKSAWPSIAGFMFASATSSPSRSSTRHEKSRPSLKIGVYAVRIIASAISSQMFTSCECRILSQTWSATGRLHVDRDAERPIHDRRDEERAGGVRVGKVPGRHERGGVDLLDDRRAEHRSAAAEVAPAVDGGLDPPVEVHRPRPDRIGWTDLPVAHGAELERRDRDLTRLDCDRVQVHELDDRLVDPVPVGSLVRLVEALDDERDRRLERHRDILLEVLL